MSKELVKVADESSLVVGIPSPSILAAQVASAVQSRSELFDYSSKIDFAYRPAIMGEPVENMSELLLKSRRNPLVYTDDMDKRSRDKNPDPFALPACSVA